MTLPFWWHWQNLNEDARGTAKGRFPWNGRAFLNFTAPWHGHSREIEWVFGKWTGVRLEIALSGDDDKNVSAAVSFLIGSLYLGAGLPRRHWLRRRLPQEDRRHIGFYVRDNNFHLSLWERDDGHHRDDPKWESTHLFLDDLFFGPATYSKTVLEKADVLIPMPEKSYPATVELLAASWTRPRWFTKRMLTCHVEIPGGIPTPGKGENSWDCGQDATFGISCQASTVHEAISKVVASVLRDRERHGGRNWTPTPKKKRRA